MRADCDWLQAGLVPDRVAVLQPVSNRRHSAYSLSRAGDDPNHRALEISADTDFGIRANGRERGHETKGVIVMWIGAIRLVVATKDSRDAGTDSLVQASVIRNSAELRVLNLDYPTEDDLERGAIRNYDYIGPTKLPRRNDQTPELPPGVGQSPMPYPGYGFEFSNGLSGHLVLRLRIRGDDMWIKDNVDLYVRLIRQRATSFDTLAWLEDSDWTYVASWTRDVPMSTDSSEGSTTWSLVLT